MPLCRTVFLPTTIVPMLESSCEKAGVWQRAAEHYTDINDIHQMAPEFVVEYFGKLNREQSISFLEDMLSRGPANVQVCVEVATKYDDELGAKELVAVFEQNKAIEGLYYYLGAIVNFSEDPIVHFKYIQASWQHEQFKEAERVCRDSNISYLRRSRTTSRTPSFPIPVLSFMFATDSDVLMSLPTTFT